MLSIGENVAEASRNTSPGLPSGVSSSSARTLGSVGRRLGPSATGGFPRARRPGRSFPSLQTTRERLHVLPNTPARSLPAFSFPHRDQRSYHSSSNPSPVPERSWTRRRPRRSPPSAYRRSQARRRTSSATRTSSPTCPPGPTSPPPSKTSFVPLAGTPSRPFRGTLEKVVQSEALRMLIGRRLDDLSRFTNDGVTTYCVQCGRPLDDATLKASAKGGSPAAATEENDGAAWTKWPPLATRPHFVGWVVLGSLILNIALFFGSIPCCGPDDDSVLMAFWWPPQSGSLRTITVCRGSSTLSPAAPSSAAVSSWYEGRKLTLWHPDRRACMSCA